LKRRSSQQATLPRRQGDPLQLPRDYFFFIIQHQGVLPARQGQAAPPGRVVNETLEAVWKRNLDGAIPGSV
jgi:hypothetical protein